MHPCGGVPGWSCRLTTSQLDNCRTPTTCMSRALGRSALALWVLVHTAASIRRWGTWSTAFNKHHPVCQVCSHMTVLSHVHTWDGRYSPRVPSWSNRQPLLSVHAHMNTPTPECPPACTSRAQLLQSLRAVCLELGHLACILCCTRVHAGQLLVLCGVGGWVRAGSTVAGL